MHRCSYAVASLLLTLFAVAVWADDAPTSQPSTQPAVIQASDTDAIAAKKGEFVSVEGVVAKAEWSKSGKVMNVYFKDADHDKGLIGSAFLKNKEKLDAEFGGDAAAHWTGAKIRLTGKVELYGGRIDSMKDRLEIVIQNPQQVVVIEPAVKP